MELTKELTFGRSKEQSIVVFSERTISRQHAQIAPEHGDKYRIFNHSSQNTWVNEQRVPEHGLLLNDGDKIRMGKVQLLFRYQRR
jgi:pSer/pThr/pTyr-binding forkhead associated (FHA) protein